MPPRNTVTKIGAVLDGDVEIAADLVEMPRMHERTFGAALERAGLRTQHVDEWGADYAETLRHWARRLDDNLDHAIRLFEGILLEKDGQLAQNRPGTPLGFCLR